MADTSVTKVDGDFSPHGKHGQKYLASGVSLAMRLWEREEPGDKKPTVRRDYETVGYVIGGRAVLHLEDESVELTIGGSWLVPRGVRHTYEITETFTAVEATSPPAQEGGRDQEPAR